jgi:hypothetical protein
MLVVMIATNNDKETLDAQTVKDGTALPVARRIATPQAAWEVFKRMRDNDDSDAQRRATLQGMIDGNPPYVPKELEDAGLASMVNVNFLTMRANLDARAAATHELFAEVPTLVEFKPVAPAPGDTAIWQHCQVMAEEYTSIVREWTNFLPYMDLVARESDAYGLGFCLFPDEWDWRPKAYKRGALLFESDASVEVSDNEIICVRDRMSAAAIFEILEDEDAARKAGWKVEALKDALIRVFGRGESQNATDKYQRSTWESVQQMRRNNETDYQVKQFDRVRLVHLLVQEVSGDRKITHLIIPENQSQSDFLFESKGHFERMDQAVWWMPYNYGDGYIKSVRGVASLMAQHDDLSNRFLCRVFDAGFTTASVMLQPQGQTDLGRLQFLQHGPYLILPPELKAIQTTFQPQLAPLIQLREVSESVMKNNTGTYRQHAESNYGRGEVRTAREVVEESSREARYEKAAVMHRYNHLERLHREMFRRMTNPEYHAASVRKLGSAEAARFVKRCMDRGVPRDLLFDNKEKLLLLVTRAVGLGSLGVKYDVTNQVLQASGMFDEVGKVNAIRDWLAPRVGYYNVDRYKSMVNRDAVPTNETSIAVLENNDMAEGVAVQVGNDQTHKLHIDVVLQGLIGPMIQAAQSGQPPQDPMKAMQTLGLAIQHVQGHAQYLAQDPLRKQYLQQLEPVIKAAVQLYQQLQRMVEQIQRQQQQQQQQQQQTLQQADQVVKDRELEAKMFEMQRKFEIQRMNQTSLAQMREEKTKAQLDLRQQQASADIQLKAQRTQAEIEIARAKAASEGANLAPR